MASSLLAKTNVSIITAFNVELDYIRVVDKQVFPSLEFIGWYTVAYRPTPRHIALHEQVRFIHLSKRSSIYSIMSLQFLPYSSTPLLLVLQPSSTFTASAEFSAGSLPFKAYEPTIEIRDRKSRAVFIEAPFKVETGEAERIAVDYAAKGGAGSATCECPSYDRDTSL